jgi:hypothetical protein
MNMSAKGKWFAGISALLLVAIVFSGCVEAEKECFYLAFTQEGETIELASGKDIVLSPPLSPEDAPKGVDYAVFVSKIEFSGVSKDTKVMVSESDKELWNGTAGEKEIVTWTLIKGTLTTLKASDVFKTKEDNITVGARKKIVGDGEYLHNETLKATSSTGSKFSYVVTYAYVAAWEYDEDNKEYEITFTPQWDAANTTSFNSTLSEEGAYPAIKIPADTAPFVARVSVSLPSETASEYDKVVLNVSCTINGKVITLVKDQEFTSGKMSVNISIYPFPSIKLGRFENKENATKAAEFIAGGLPAPTALTSGDYSVTLKYYKEGNEVTATVTLKVEKVEIVFSIGYPILGSKEV